MIALLPVIQVTYIIVDSKECLFSQCLWQLLLHYIDIILIICSFSLCHAHSDVGFGIALVFR